MIEVEMQFQPSEEEQKKLLDGAEFIGEVENHDIYYDFFDYRLAKEGIKPRKRNGSFELKIEIPGGADKEIEDEEEIKKYFRTTVSMDEFVKTSMIIFFEIKTKRKKYKKEGFNIDVDECDFGYNMTEIELMVENEDNVKESKEKIKEFAQKNGLTFGKTMSKRKAYLTKNNPDLFKKIYGDKN